ncbi:TIGR01620 family protein [Salinivibrio sp. IB868]|uniref:YcjF family protein n=1 Tax=unclassified Salinivibrio TaxID=2636825 RepID=UPI000985BBD1|nr:MULTISPECIES: TIGR01620 family protein [unclassified Salinivibrio]OOE65364.1 TIGR01620 family protein [Salinivibrio sp. IB868]OOE77427.1 TIGR01620 family protein [Salinivibrio sp. IB870]
MTHYKPKQTFAQNVGVERDTESQLQQGTQFESETDFTPVSSEEWDADLDATLRPSPRKRRRVWPFLLLVTVLLAVWQSADSVYQSWLERDWLSLGWQGLLVAVATTGLVMLGKEWRAMRRLVQREAVREQAEQLLSSDAVGQGERFCQQLAEQTGQAQTAAFANWQQQLAATHNDSEILSLYEQQVLSAQDKAARDLVTKHAQEAALMVAVSPLAAADMLLVAWRNFHLMTRIAQIYGIQLGVKARFRLLKMVLTNMALAGASEAMTDVGFDVLSVNIAGRVSGRVAQGLGIGLLTARLGLKTMTLMRPLPWHGQAAPSLSQLRRELVKRLVGKRQQDAS